MQPLPVDVAEDVLLILRETGRTVEPHDWVGRIVREEAEAKWDALPHHEI